MLLRRTREKHIEAKRGGRLSIKKLEKGLYDLEDDFREALRDNDTNWVKELTLDRGQYQRDLGKALEEKASIKLNRAALRNLQMSRETSAQFDEVESNAFRELAVTLMLFEGILLPTESTKDFHFGGMQPSNVLRTPMKL
jgi:hypothetical protein